MVLYDGTTAPLGILGRVLCMQAAPLGLDPGPVGSEVSVRLIPWEAQPGAQVQGAELETS